MWRSTFVPESIFRRSIHLKQTSRRGIKLRFLLVLFFLCFPMKGDRGHVQSSRENPGAPRLLMTALQTHSDELNWARRRPFQDGTSHEKFNVRPRPLSSNLYRGKRFSNHVRMRTIQSRKPVKRAKKTRKVDQKIPMKSCSTSRQ